MIIEPSVYTVLFENLTTRRRQLKTPSGLIPTIGTSQDVEAKLEVFYEASHRPRDCEIGKSQSPRRTGDLSMCWYNSVAGLMPRHTRHVRRQPNRASNITSKFDRRKAAS